MHLSSFEKPEPSLHQMEEVWHLKDVSTNAQEFVVGPSRDTDRRHSSTKTRTIFNTNQFNVWKNCKQERHPDWTYLDPFHHQGVGENSSTDAFPPNQARDNSPDQICASKSTHCFGPSLLLHLCVYQDGNNGTNCQNK